MKWNRGIIYDLCDINPENITRKYPFDKIRYFDITSVGSGVVSVTDEISLSEAPSRAKRIVRNNDTIIAMVRPGNKSFYFFKSTVENYVASTGFAVLRPKINLTDPRFLYYLISEPGFTAYLVANEQGANYPAVNPDVIGDRPIEFPDLIIQRKIASILSAYDDLIENNLKRIRLLEERAFLSYKVIVNSEKLEERKLNQVTQFLKRGISPKYVDNDGVIVLNQKCVRNHRVSFEDSRLTDSDKPIPEERMLQKFDTVINSTGTGTLGRIAMNIQDEFAVTVDSHVTIVRANQEITPIYLCMSLFTKENIIEMMGEGATNQTELSPKKVGEEIKIPVLSKKVMNEFEAESTTAFNLIWNLQKQNTKLHEARDILLPRLMSGEIEV